MRGAVKTEILPGLRPEFQGDSHQMSNKPPNMLNMAKNRIWPSENCSSCVKVRRQPAGEIKGNNPSITSTMAVANQNVSLFKVYFFPGPAAPPPLRKTLKNSDEAGSSTITSLLLLKLAL